MTAMIDAQCPKCRKRFGWCGTMKGMPACPRCGFRRPQAELDSDEKEMEDFRELLRTHPSKATCPQRQRQRIMAGLSLRQAAKQMGIAHSLLSDYEHGRAEPPAEITTQMATLYGVGDES